jgi:Zn-dependent metalloprotease
LILISLLGAACGRGGATTDDKPTAAAPAQEELAPSQEDEARKIAEEDVQGDPGIQRSVREEDGGSLEIAESSSDDDLDTTRFQAFRNGLEVVGSMAVHHRGAQGSWIRNQIASFDLDTKPSLSAEEALDIARAHVGAERGLEAEPLLKILPSEDAESARLVYWIDFKEGEFSPGRTLVVDAHSGELVGDLSEHLSATVPGGKAKGPKRPKAHHTPRAPKRGPRAPRAQKIHHVAEIKVFSAKDQGFAVAQGIDPNLPGYDQETAGCEWTDLSNGATKDSSRCAGLRKKGCQLVAASGPLAGFPFQVAPKACSEGDDRSAQNAEANARRVLDYYWNHHKRNSYDNRGAELVSVVHGGIKLNNAFWSLKQNIMVYGDGDGMNFGDFAEAIDVAGHEMTHGVTAHTAKLLMMGESGALNEAYSDFFGKLIEGKGDWVVGRSVIKGRSGVPGIRDLANPANLTVTGPKGSIPYPSHMKEKLPSSGPCSYENDNCWVHVNSTIPSHAAYLVAQAIGVEKAEHLYFLTLTHSLTARDGFQSAATATEEMCAHLYDAPTCGKVKAAFAEVGL